MDHSGHGGMDMSGTSTASMPSATDEASMSMDHGMGNGCNISMLWNWNIIDSCFISSTWKITSRGMFAGSCIGVILLVMTLELLRRSVKEYDRYIIRSHNAKTVLAGNVSNNDAKDGIVAPPPCSPVAFRPSLLQQAIRAFLHMLQFAVAYFVMLLAMYYNGYIIICIFIGAFLGAFVFQWEQLSDGRSPTSAAREATVCCG